ncbi:MAG: hypothetical protein H7Y86_07040 [Rhizobacter sp.]|nr:hypothetical protein [Ferruginibacter sp.]
MFILVILFGLPAVLILIDFINFIVSGRRLYGPGTNLTLEIATFIVLPAVYLFLFDGKVNDCCGDTATFSPPHKLYIYTLIIICVLNYFYSSLHKGRSGPVPEVIKNSILLISLVFNIFIARQIDGEFLWLFGNAPIIMLLIMQLIKNHRSFLALNNEGPSGSAGFMETCAWKILMLKPFIKITFLFVLCLPLLSIITAFLMIFGQKPDSAIRAFTDTYRQGFSELDHLCDNVACGGHYLCSVAAKGHKKLVKPRRLGLRNGQLITCNRQLLIANAFEDMLQEKFPALHRYIRNRYNKVGNYIHKYYHFFNIKIVSDFTYILMKPAEWIFLLALYCVDEKPENRIEKQYLHPADRQIADLYTR